MQSSATLYIPCKVRQIRMVIWVATSPVIAAYICMAMVLKTLSTLHLEPLLPRNCSVYDCAGIQAGCPVLGLST